jgi:SEC-C motif-containing protein
MTCHCGRTAAFADCCKALLKGVKATTAEDLMRSRYAAFVEADVDYILDTYATETRPVDQREDILSWAKEVEWQKLEVVSTEKGDAADEEGFVEFKAYYKEEGVDQVLHEKSFFKREKGNWVYVSGEYPKEEKPKLPNRNEPCFCGSGKKFKKCCLGKH